MNESMPLNDYYVSTLPVEASSPRHPAPRSSAHRRTVRRAVASRLHRLADHLDS
ncbi:MAG: hypothetical protein AVDCRST_MAG34-3060 [uncultured Nocardioidaceae bacterium]|uniref:Uncharacterized protein n=1 Tax=uncultured Nocardioidaceae bacterium TaxID=253824 RepID=A0A6J4MRS3_9ACTN|nr:MAG: hypothetical protein AVDCRST_MAG34-3060 [uncultured Nocardioidaceae bacterium]